MEKHYFIGEGPEAEKLIAATLERREVATEARMALMQDYGADGLIKRDWDGGSIVGLGFKQKTDAPYLKGGERVADGYAYYPKLNTNAGKQLAKRLEDGGRTMNCAKHKSAVEKAAKAYYDAMDKAFRSGFRVKLAFPPVGRNTDERTLYVQIYEKTNFDPKEQAGHFRAIKHAQSALFKALKSAAKRRYFFNVTCNGVTEAVSRVF